MKILFTVEYYHPHTGGAEEVVRQLAERLALRGHEVHVATSASLERQFIKKNGVTVHSFNLGGNAVRGIRGTEEEIERYQDVLRHDFDCIIWYAMQTWTTDLAFDILPQIQAKKICIPCGYSGLHKASYKKYFEELPSHLAHYDTLVHMSERTQDAVFDKTHGFEDKSVLIPNGASFEEFVETKHESLRSLLGITTKYICISVSNHYRAKGHRFVIDAFKKMNRTDTTLLIIGEVPGSGWRHTAHQVLGCYPYCVTSSVFNKQIRLVSGKDRGLVLAAYKEADVFVFGSRIECAPLVMYESFASKTAFVSTRVGNVADHSEYVRIVQNPDEMAKVVNNLLDTPSKRKKLTDTAFAAWKTSYTWEKIVDLYEKLVRYGRI